MQGVGSLRVFPPWLGYMKLVTGLSFFSTGAFNCLIVSAQSAPLQFVTTCLVVWSTMKNNKQKGFTLIELVVVIVILGILAVTAAPRFLNFQRDAHLARAETAFANFENATYLFHSKWLAEGEPTGVVDYGQGDVYPSSTGFPASVGRALVDPSRIEGEQCFALWDALMDTDITARAQGSDTVLPSDTDVVVWYTGSNECYYYYTTGYSSDEDLPKFFYSPLTGETRLEFTSATSS